MLVFFSTVHFIFLIHDRIFPNLHLVWPTVSWLLRILPVYSLQAPETVDSGTTVLSLVIKASLWHTLLDSVKNWIKWNQFNKYSLSAYCLEGIAGLGGDT